MVYTRGDQKRDDDESGKQQTPKKDEEKKKTQERIFMEIVKSKSSGPASAPPPAQLSPAEQMPPPPPGAIRRPPPSQEPTFEGPVLPPVSTAPPGIATEGYGGPSTRYHPDLNQVQRPIPPARPTRRHARAADTRPASSRGAVSTGDGMTMGGPMRPPTDARSSGQQHATPAPAGDFSLAKDIHNAELKIRERNDRERAEQLAAQWEAEDTAMPDATDGDVSETEEEDYINQAIDNSLSESGNGESRGGDDGGFVADGQHPGLMVSAQGSVSQNHARPPPSAPPLDIQCPTFPPEYGGLTEDMPVRTGLPNPGRGTEREIRDFLAPLGTYPVQRASMPGQNLPQAPPPGQLPPTHTFVDPSGYRLPNNGLPPTALPFTHIPAPPPPDNREANLQHLTSTMQHLIDARQIIRNHHGQGIPPDGSKEAIDAALMVLGYFWKDLGGKRNRRGKRE